MKYFRISSLYFFWTSEWASRPELFYAFRLESLIFNPWIVAGHLVVATRQN